MKKTSVLSKSKKLAYLLFMVYVIAYIGRHNYSAALTEIVASGLFTKAEAGIIGTVYFASYGSGQIIFGCISDRFSPYKLITFGLFGAALSNFSMMLAPNITAMTIFWGLNGISQSILWPASFYLISNIMAKEYRTRACLIMSVAVPVGTILAYFISGTAIKSGWKAAFLCPSLILAVMGTVFVFLSSYFKKSLKKEEKKSIEKKEKSSSKIFFKALVSSGVIILFIPVLLHGMLRDGLTAWVPTMIRETYGTDTSLSVFVSVVLPVINLSGAYISMLIYEKLTKNNEVTAGFISLLLGIIPMIILLFLKRINMYTSVFSLAFATTCMTSFNHIILTVLPLKFAKFGKASTLTGTLNALTYAGCASSNLVFGFTSEHWGWSSTVIIWLSIFVIAAIITATVIKKWKDFKNSN